METTHVLGLSSVAKAAYGKSYLRLALKKPKNKPQRDRANPQVALLPIKQTSVLFKGRPQNPAPAENP